MRNVKHQNIVWHEDRPDGVHLTVIPARMPQSIAREYIMYARVLGNVNSDPVFRFNSNLDVIADFRRVIACDVEYPDKIDGLKKAVEDYEAINDVMGT